MILHEKNDEPWESMKSDCSKCSGLCCTALFFSKVDGFPKDKIAGKPCINLQKDYRCKIHSQLEQQKMRGCIGYDCFGAGQQVTEIIYKGKAWDELPNQSAEIFDVFTTLLQIYQIRYFLVEASLLTFTGELKRDIHKLIVENVQIANCSPEKILSIDMQEYRNNINALLKKVCKLLKKMLNSKDCPKDFIGKNFKGNDMSGMDFRDKLLIAANLSDCIFNGAIFLGADTRDTNFSGADLRETIFLTQGQINSAKGNRKTKIPTHLDYPPTWG